MWFLGGGDPSGPRPFAPPDNEVPVVIPLGLTARRTSDASLTLTHAEVYSRGWRLHLGARLRPGAGRSFYDASRGRFDHEDGLLGVEYADGRRGASLGPGTDGGPDMIVVHGGGGGGPHEQDGDWWMSPLPVAGPVSLVLLHRAVHDEEMRVELDGAPLLGAAAGVVELWPWEPEPPVEESSAVDLDLPPDGWFRRFLDGRPPR